MIDGFVSYLLAMMPKNVQEPLGTATRTSPNKRFHEKNIYSFVHKL